MTKTDFDNKLTSFNKSITSKKKIIEAQKKLKSLFTKNYNLFFSTISFKSNDGSQSTFIWKSKGVYVSALKSLNTDFLQSIKISAYRMGIKFDKDPLAVEQKNYLTKIVNVYIVYDLNLGKINPTNNFKLKICSNQ